MKELILILFLAITFQSCVPVKKLYFFHNQEPRVQQIDREKQSSIQVVKQGNRLNISVSVPDANQASFLNPLSGAMANASAGGQGNRFGYLVDKDGYIKFPLLDTVFVLNKTPDEVAEIITAKLEYFYKDPFVVVNIQGQVYYLSGKGGAVIPISNERLTIFEAITQATNQDPYELRDKLWLIREENNERLFVQLDLTDKSIFDSPYYYLRNNDQLYMRPGRFSGAFAPNSPVGFLLALSGVVTAVIFLLRSI